MLNDLSVCGVGADIDALKVLQVIRYTQPKPVVGVKLA